MSLKDYRITYFPDSESKEWLIQGENLGTRRRVQVRSGMPFDKDSFPDVPRLNKKAYELFNLSLLEMDHIQTQVYTTPLPALKCKFFWRGDDRWDVQWACDLHSNETCIKPSFKFEDPWVLIANLTKELRSEHLFFGRTYGEIIAIFTDWDFIDG